MIPLLYVWIWFGVGFVSTVCMLVGYWRDGDDVKLRDVLGAVVTTLSGPAVLGMLAVRLVPEHTGLASTVLIKGRRRKR